MEPLSITRIAHIRPTPPTDRWLVEGLWAWPAVGFIGGTPKASKTWLALELAVAVASGRPCLGCPVPLKTPSSVPALSTTFNTKVKPLEPLL
jgi:RecA-family ATPase